MCNSQHLFGNFRALSRDLEVSSWRWACATDQGTVTLKMNLPNGKENKRILHDVLLVLDLIGFNSFSVSRATEAGKSTEFTKSACAIREEKGNWLVAQGYKEGNLYYLDQEAPAQAYTVSSETWHRLFGHLGTQSLMELSKKQINGTMAV